MKAADKPTLAASTPKKKRDQSYKAGDTVNVTYGPAAPCQGKVLAFDAAHQQVTIEDEDGLEQIVDTRFAIKV